MFSVPHMAKLQLLFEFPNYFIKKIKEKEMAFTGNLLNTYHVMKNCTNSCNAKIGLYEVCRIYWPKVLRNRWRTGNRTSP